MTADLLRLPRVHVADENGDNRDLVSRETLSGLGQLDFGDEFRPDKGRADEQEDDARLLEVTDNLFVPLLPGDELPVVPTSNHALLPQSFQVLAEFILKLLVVSTHTVRLAGSRRGAALSSGWRRACE